MNPHTIAGLAQKVMSGDRRSLARAITLIESARAKDLEPAQLLLKAILPQTGKSVRIGISGVPGAGKSTFLERFGLYWISRGRRLAVLAVDPSSSVSGGSILGDKTRMPGLSRSEDAFIRPSPSGGITGGVARRTRESILLCEAAGYDTIMVETVGVGQAEVEVAAMTDFFLLLMLPNAGDELQGMKKGILELVDCIVVNKVDTDRPAAMRTQAQLKTALHLMRSRTPNWTVPILLASALEGIGLEEIDAVLTDFRTKTTGTFLMRRRLQNRDWMWSLARESLMKSFFEHPEVKAIRRDLEEEVMQGETTPVLAAEELLRKYLGSPLQEPPLS